MAFNLKEHYLQLDKMLDDWDKILEENDNQIRSLKEVIQGKEKENERSICDR